MVFLSILLQANTTSSLRLLLVEAPSLQLEFLSLYLSLFGTPLLGGTPLPPVGTLRSSWTPPPSLSLQLECPSSSCKPWRQLGSPSLQLEPPSLQLKTPSLQLELPSLQLKTPSLQLEPPSLQLKPHYLQLEPPSLQLKTPTSSGNQSCLVGIRNASEKIYLTIIHVQ